MRREADFVLEKAAWPTLLLESGGSVCRANHAARQIFGLTDDLAAVSLAALWDEQNASPAAKFLEDQNGQPAAQVQLKLPSNQKGQFIAHVAGVARDGQDYFLLQLFKENGAAFAELTPAPASVAAPAPAAPKPAAEDFLLQNAPWPALLVDQGGKILKANGAAAHEFGAVVEREGAHLDSIWSPQNKESCGKFLTSKPSTDPVHINFLLKSGSPADFLAQVCATGRAGVFALQLTKAPPPPESKTSERKTSTPSMPSTPAPAPAAAVTPADAAANLAHKQKLDCALQLARSVALDFNNALTSILGHSSLLLSQAEADHPWRGSLSEIEKSAAKAAETANDLAAFSRQEKDMKVQVAGNLNSLLERTMEVFQSSAQRPIKMPVQLERKLFTANFDEAKMQQALVKIFENAAESIAGEGQISLRTLNKELPEATQDGTAKLNAGNYVCVEVIDNGAGIAPEVMPRIFEPFFTTKGSTHRGLGLAWVYGIVTNHGGGVAVSSQPGAGTTVRLYIPANRKIVKETKASDGDLRGTETILLVDDEDLLLTMGRMVLSSYGYTVLTANSGQNALELFTQSKKKIDLVITDLVMPNMSGRELGEHILKAVPGTKIVWSSGYVRSANEAENDRYLQKPFTTQDLLRKVKQVLAQ